MAMSDEVQRLQELHQSGALTDEEFQQAKAQVLQQAQFQSQAQAGDSTAAPTTEAVAPHSSAPSSVNERQWALFLHLSTLGGFVVPLLGLIAPILIWQLKKDEMPSLDAHGKVVTNWILSALLYGIGCFVLSFLLIGIPLAFALAALCVIFPIIGGIKANNGELWKYPMSIQFLK